MYVCMYEVSSAAVLSLKDAAELSYLISEYLLQMSVSFILNMYNI